MRNPVRRVLKRAVPGFCAPSSAFEMCSFYKVGRLSPDDMNRFRSQVENDSCNGCGIGWPFAHSLRCHVRDVLL